MQGRKQLVCYLPQRRAFFANQEIIFSQLLPDIFPGDNITWISFAIRMIFRHGQQNFFRAQDIHLFPGKNRCIMNSHDGTIDIFLQQLLGKNMDIAQWLLETLF